MEKQKSVLYIINDQYLRLTSKSELNNSYSILK